MLRSPTADHNPTLRHHSPHGGVGKEAVFKSLGVSGKGAAASLRDIEILPDESGAPQVTLHGDAKSAAEAKGVKKVLVSLSHSDSVAIAFAQASSS